MSKSNLKEAKVSVALPNTVARKVMLFNRFRVQREPGFCILYFGLESEDTSLLDAYSCAVTNEAIQENKKSCLEYLERLGGVLPTPPWKRVLVVGQGVDVCDIFNLSSRGKMAETVLSVYSHGGAVRAAQAINAKDSVIQAEHLCLLRSDVETQRSFITALYGE